ncbi:MAG TPA: ATP-binding protein [Thermoanaerobaculia bacterium]|nr:ATP-binding protein [Thermoanaerobaculia bacterium]
MQTAHLTSLHETALGLMNRLELGALLEALVARSTELLGTPDGFLYLETEGGARLECRVWIGSRPRDRFAEPNEGAVGHAWSGGETVAIEDYDAWPGRSPQVPAGTFGAMLAVPLRSGGRVAGALGVAHDARSGRRFGDAEVSLLSGFGQLASIALENARLFEQARSEIEERKRAQEALEKAEELRENLTRTIVHDLKNPLSSVLGSVEFLLTGGGLTPAQRRVLEIAQTNGRRLVTMVETILDVSRLEEGLMPVAPERVALGALVAEVLELQRPLAEPRGLSLESAVPAGLPEAWADRALTMRVLQNLVGNAVKFTPREGSVRVAAALDGADWLRVVVSDTGPGVPEELRGRLFEMFASGREKESGSGLGLSFCRLAVEAQGGRIAVEDVPGAGATFAFTLPLAPRS